jgi:hypothetical protein
VGERVGRNVGWSFGLNAILNFSFVLICKLRFDATDGDHAPPHRKIGWYPDLD